MKRESNSSDTLINDIARMTNYSRGEGSQQMLLSLRLELNKSSELNIDRRVHSNKGGAVFISLFKTHTGFTNPKTIKPRRRSYCATTSSAEIWLVPGVHCSFSKY